MMAGPPPHALARANSDPLILPALLQSPGRAARDAPRRSNLASFRAPSTTEAHAMQGFGDRMRIAQIAPLAETVPPALYGGTERVVSWLTEELVRQGHDV